MPTGKILKELSRYKIGTFAYIIHRHSLLRPDAEAYVYGEERVTYAEFNARVNSLVHALQELGLSKGDPIGLLSWNCLEYAIVYGAAMKGGYLLSRFNPRLAQEELDYLINYSEVGTLFVGPELVAATTTLKPSLATVKNYISLEGKSEGMISIGELLNSSSTEEPYVEIDEDDSLHIIYTSGTTGTPRGAVYTNRHVWEDTRTFIINTGLQPSDRHIQVTPLFHIAGDTIFRSMLYLGACNIIMKNFDPAETLRLIQDEKATYMSIVPTHLVAILALPDVKKYDTSSLKMMWYGGSPMPLEVLKRGIETFGPAFGQGKRSGHLPPAQGRAYRAGFAEAENTQLHRPARRGRTGKNRQRKRRGPGYG